MEQYPLIIVAQNEALRAELQSLKLQVASLAPLRRFLMRARLSHSLLELVKSRIEADLPSYSGCWLAVHRAGIDPHFRRMYLQALESLSLQEQQLNIIRLDSWMLACDLPLPKLPPTWTELLEQVGGERALPHIVTYCKALYL